MNYKSSSKFPLPSPNLSIGLKFQDTSHQMRSRGQQKKESPLHKYRLPKQCNASHTEGVTLGEGEQSLVHKVCWQVAIVQGIQKYDHPRE